MRVSRSTTGVLAVAAVVGCLCLGTECLAEWTWDADAGWINMGEPPPSSDQGLYGYAAGLFTRGDCAAASEYFDKVLTLFPESPFAGKAQFGLARCEARLGRPANAVRLCNELLMQKPEGVKLDEVVSFQLEQLKLLSGRDPQRAEELIETVVQGAPSPELQYEATLRRAHILMAAERYDEAREAALAAAGCAPSEPLREDAQLLAGMCDLIVCQTSDPSLMRMDRAASLLRPVARSGRTDAQAATAQEYLALIQAAENEPDVRRMRVYMAAVLLYRNRTAEAREFFGHARKKFKNSAAGELASFYYAETFLRSQEYWAAFKAYQAFVTAYPHTARMRQTVEREFRIGQELGAKQERGEAITVMEAVADNEPSGPLADDALMFIGRSQLAWGHSDNAKETFDRLLKGYPRSEWASAALFFGGVADLRNSDLAGDREELLAQARSAFEVYLRNEPNGTFAADASKQLAATKEKQAADLVKIAGFYKRRDEPKAAGVYYAVVTGSFPDTVAAPQAQGRLEALEREGGARP